MKIVCDACQAKYSISDDKVQGKVFKIRCKKCSNIIVVRGGAGAAEPAPVPQEKDTRVYDYGYDGGAGDQAPAADDAVWHLVINQDQVGPMTVAEVQQRFASGEVDGETFTWREGFADWLPLAQVDVFSALVVSGSTTTAGGGGAAAIGAMFGSGNDDGGTSRSDPGDLFASASSGRASQHEDDDGGDLFGAKPAAAASSGGAAAANAKMRGERNENSVLFSLNNLAQLASDKPAISTPSSQSGGGGAGHATGAAGGEGSGLIDIRSMASAYMGGGGASMGKVQTASAIGSIDDLPVFGGGGFSEPAVLVPTVSRAGNNKMMYMMIAAVSLLAVVAIIMVVILMKSGNKNPPPQVASAETGSAKAENAGDKTPDKVADTAKGSDTTGVAATTGSDVAKTPDTDTAKTPDKTTDTAKTPDKTVAKTPDKTTSKPATRPTTTTTTSSRPNVAATKPDKKPDTTTTTASKPDTGGGCDEVSCVLNNYEGSCCSKFKKGGGSKPATGGSKPASGGGADLPDGLDRAMISTGIGNVKARVSSCGDKSSAKGKVKVHVKVGGDGRVSNVAVESSPDAGLGSCVAAAVQKASFAKTQNGGSFSYPFVF